MSPVPKVVYIIVDREFGEKLSALEPGVSVWIVDTPTNKAVVQHLWKELPKDRPSDITTFKFVETASLSTRIKDKLSAYGFDRFRETPEGFKSRRQTPST